MDYNKQGRTYRGQANDCTAWVTHGTNPMKHIQQSLHALLSCRVLAHYCSALVKT
jgi:hypothetical protein